MPVLELGRRPDLLRVMTLRRGDPFYSGLKLVDEDDAYTVPPVLVFPLPGGGEIRWEAVLEDEKTAVFNADPVQVNHLITSSVSRTAILEYDGLTWAAGKFEVLD